MIKTAVLLSTYNGQKYVLEQLESIRLQSVKPDAVIISDDNSSDDTVAKVNDYIVENNLADWTVRTNSENLGWKKNFRQEILRISCDYDYIFLCDQDDIWERNKIETMIETVNKNPDIELLASSYEPFYEDDVTRITNKIAAELGNDGSIKQIPLDEKMMYVMRPGCSFLVSNRMCKEICNYWDDQFAHDAILWRFSIIRKSAFLLNCKLIKWRRYQSSSSNHDDKSSRRHYMISKYNQIVSGSNSHALCLKKMIAYAKATNSLNEEEISMLERNCKFKNAYYIALRDKKLLSSIIISIKNRKFFLSLKSILANVYVLSYVKIFG